MAKYTSYTKKSSSKKFWKASGYLGTNQKTGEVKYFNRQGFATKLDAKDAFETAQSNFKEQTTILISIPDRKRFKDVYAEWWEMYKSEVEASSALKITRDFKNHIIPRFGEYYIDAITIMDAEKWTRELAKKLVAFSKVVGRAKQVMRFAVRAEYIQRNPFDYIEKPRKHKVAKHEVTQNWYSLPELQAFIKAISELSDADNTPQRDWSMAKAFLLTTVSTGMRRGEVIGLKWNDINWDTECIEISRAQKRDEHGVYIGTTKSENGLRTVMLDGAAIDALKRWRADEAHWLTEQGLPAITKEGWIFPNRRHPDQYIGENTPRDWMVDLCEQKHVRRITLHGLRHTKATIASEAGAKPADLAQIMGHANGAFTLSHYVHPTQEGVVNAESLFNQYVFGPDTPKTDSR